jgi:hypothetical protein
MSLNLEHRNKKLNDIHESKWNGLGGKFEVGESPQECVIREGQFFSAKFEYEEDQMLGYEVVFHS